MRSFLSNGLVFWFEDAFYCPPRSHVQLFILNTCESLRAAMMSHTANGNNNAVDIHMPIHGITELAFASFSPVILRI